MLQNRRHVTVEAHNTNVNLKRRIIGPLKSLFVQFIQKCNFKEIIFADVSFIPHISNSVIHLFLYSDLYTTWEDINCACKSFRPLLRKSFTLVFAYLLLTHFSVLLLTDSSAHLPC